MSGLTQASSVQASLLKVGITGSPALFKNAYPAFVGFLSQALSSKDVHIAYRVRLDDVVTFPWLLTLTAPVPLAAEFQPLNTYLSRVKTFALTAVATP